MPIDCHAHYVPRELVHRLADRAGDFALRLEGDVPSCRCAVHFDGGLKVRPFFPKLVEPVADRLAGMARQGVDRQVLSTWGDLFGYALDRRRGAAWHRFLNEEMSRLCEAHPDRFSFLASVPLQDADAAAAELDHAMRRLGAVGGVVAANVEGANLGERPLDPFWHAAVELDAGIFIHPVEPVPVARARKFALVQIAQYTQDTTLCVGSLIFSGVLDRFPTLRLLLSHGGGGVPYLAGRFDVMHARMDRAAQGDVAAAAPSAYLRRFFYDTIVHDAATLRFLADRTGTDRLVLGTDYSFPPADETPLASADAAGLDVADLDANAGRLFPALRPMGAA